MNETTKTKHTPGPWSARLYEKGPGHSRDNVAAYIDCEKWEGKGNKRTTVGGTVAQVSWSGTGDGYSAHANAALIAASPDLYAALQAALPYIIIGVNKCQAALPDDEEHAGRHDGLESFIDAARAAIRKAGGA